MDSSQVHISINKYSKLEVVEKATKIIEAIDNHAADNCPHCLNLLNEVYKGKDAGFTRPSRTEPIPEPAIPRVNQNQANIQAGK